MPASDGRLTRPRSLPRILGAHLVVRRRVRLRAADAEGRPDASSSLRRERHP
jgi:hypothetical protein